MVLKDKTKMETPHSLILRGFIVLSMTLKGLFFMPKFKQKGGVMNGR